MIITIGLGIMIIFFLAVAHLLDEKFIVYKAVALYTSLLLVLVLSSHLNTLTDNYYCSIELKNTTLSQGGNFTEYNYDRVCYSYEKNTGLTAFKLVNYFVRYLPWYIFVMIIYFIFRELGYDILDEIRKLLGK